MKNGSIYKTKDFYSSCVLRVLGYELQKIEHVDSKFASFVFNDPNQSAGFKVIDYWDKKIKVDARSFVEAINELKTRLYAKQ